MLALYIFNFFLGALNLYIYDKEDGTIFNFFFGILLPILGVIGITGLM